MDDSELLKKQLRYYRQRAPEYEQWWLRQERYDRGSQQAAAWRLEARRVESALAEAAPCGRVLELAAGTGIWSHQLAATASSLTVVDAAPEMLAMNRQKTAPRCASRSIPYEQIQADLFDWNPPEKFDFLFFGFWLSHVPPSRLDAFWHLVREALSPEGEFFFVDSRRDIRSQAADHPKPEPGSMLTTRRLNDGSTHQIVKIFYEPAQLEVDLVRRGFDVRVQASGEFFIHGRGRLAQETRN